MTKIIIEPGIWDNSNSKGKRYRVRVKGCNGYIHPFLGKMKLGVVRSKHIAQVLEAVRRKGRGEQMVMHVYNVLHKMFEDAVEHYEYLERNPVVKRLRPQVTTTPRTFLTPTQALLLLTKAKNHYLDPAIYLGYFAGLRPSEVQALEWDSISFQPPQLLIRAAYKRRHLQIEPWPKGKEWGRVPMEPQLAEYLENLKTRSTNKFVAHEKNGMMLDYQRFLIGLRGLCREAEVPQISPHELRHSCTELWVTAGATREDISRVLNQKSQAIVERYMHRTDVRTAAVALNVCVPGLNAPVPPPRLRIVR